jgi:phenylacetate-CoA ligase
MVVVRGINAFPTQVAAVINQFAELSGEYRIVLDGPGPYDVLPVEAETADAVVPGEALAGALEARIKRELGASAKVSLVAYNTLPRTEGKTRRVIRKDKP